MIVMKKKIFIVSLFVLFFVLFHNSQLLRSDSFFKKFEQFFTIKKKPRRKLADLSVEEQNSQKLTLQLLVDILDMQKNIDDLNFHYKRLKEESGDILTEEMYEDFQNAYSLKLKALRKQKKDHLQWTLWVLIFFL